VEQPKEEKPIIRVKQPPKPKPAEPPTPGGLALVKELAPAPPPDPEQVVRNTLRMAHSAFEACYEDSLRKDSRLKGRVVVTIDVLASGTVASAKITESTVTDTSVLTCISLRLRQLRFPPLGEEIEATLPLVLSPRPL
jgi:hypothetical protein